MQVRRRFATVADAVAVLTAKHKAGLNRLAETFKE